MLLRQVNVISGLPYTGTMIDSLGAADVANARGVIRVSSCAVRTPAGRKRFRPRSFRTTRPASAPAPSWRRIVSATPAYRGNCRAARHCDVSAAALTLPRCPTARSGAVIRQVVDVSSSRCGRARLAAATLELPDARCVCPRCICVSASALRFDTQIESRARRGRGARAASRTCASSSRKRRAIGDFALGASSSARASVWPHRRRR